MHGECTAGVVCTVRRPVHFYCVLKCTHKALTVHSKSFYTGDMLNNVKQFVTNSILEFANKMNMDNLIWR